MPTAPVLVETHIHSSADYNARGKVWQRPAREVPPGLSRARVLELMGAFFALGPFGFRGPAAEHVPDQLTQVADGVRTTQLIAPGYACASNDFLARALKRVSGLSWHRAVVDFVGGWTSSTPTQASTASTMRSEGLIGALALFRYKSLRLTFTG